MPRTAPGPTPWRRWPPRARGRRVEDRTAGEGERLLLAATRAWAQARSAESLAIGRQYLQGQGPFLQRLAQLNLTARFATDFYALVGEWARWASGVVEAWPDDPGQATPDPAMTEDIVRRAAAAVEPDAG